MRERSNDFRKANSAYCGIGEKKRFGSLWGASDTGCRQMQGRHIHYIGIDIRAVVSLDVDFLAGLSEHGSNLGIAILNVGAVGEGDQRVVAGWNSRETE